MEEQYIVVVFDTHQSPTECLVYCVLAEDLDGSIDAVVNSGELPGHIDLADKSYTFLACGVHETQALCGRFDVGWLIQ